MAVPAGGGGAQPQGRQPAGLHEAARQRAMAERCALLDVLVVLWAAAGRGCGAERWVELAGALRRGVLAGSSGGGDSTRRRAELLVRSQRKFCFVKPALQKFAMAEHGRVSSHGSACVMAAARTTGGV